METCVFPPIGLEKPVEIFEPFLVYIITSVRPTNTPYLVVHRGRRHTVVKFHGFVTFVLFFKIFFPFPHLAYRSQFWTNSHVLWLKRRVLFRTRAFSGFGAFKFTFKGPLAQKTPKFRPVFGLGRFAAEIASALEPQEYTLKRQDNPTKVRFLIGSYKPGVPFSYWRFNRKCIFQDGSRRHLVFRKTVAISLLLDQSSPNLVGMLRI